MILFNRCCVLVSYAFILIGKEFVCRHTFVAMYIFVFSFRGAKYCNVPPCVVDRLGCTAVECLRISAIDGSVGTLRHVVR
jgi:hypothetical protein